MNAVKQSWTSAQEAHQQIVGIVQGGLLVIKWWESHALEVTSVTLLPPHHDPHGSPLRHVHWLDDPWDLVHEADCSCDVVQHLWSAHSPVSRQDSWQCGVNLLLKDISYSSQQHDPRVPTALICIGLFTAQMMNG